MDAGAAEAGAEARAAATDTAGAGAEAGATATDTADAPARKSFVASATVLALALLPRHQLHLELLQPDGDGEP